MERPGLEVADIFRAHGPAWRQAQRGHLSLGQLKVMSAIEQCRTAALGGHALRCDACEHVDIAYNSCRNRHCPKCQANAARRWLEARQNELLPVEYYHVVFTLPAPVAALAWYNKALIYRLLFDAAAQTLCTIAADPKHLGARIGATLVLHTWGSALTQHLHVHGIVPGGGLSPDGTRWIACRRGFFLPVRVLSRLFWRRFLDALAAAHRTGQLRLFGEFAALAEPSAFVRWMAPLRHCEWVVYAKRPFEGPKAVLAYLSRYTHRVAISNRRLVAMDERGVTFRWKDYPAKDAIHKTMTLDAGEFMRRFLLHVLPTGFTGFGTTGSLPTAAARSTWRWRAHCCMCHRPSSRPMLPNELSRRSSVAIVARRWRSPPSSCRTTRFTHHHRIKALRHERPISNLFAQAVPRASVKANVEPRCLRRPGDSIASNERGQDGPLAIIKGIPGVSDTKSVAAVDTCLATGTIQIAIAGGTG